MPGPVSTGIGDHLRARKPPLQPATHANSAFNPQQDGTEYRPKCGDAVQLFYKEVMCILVSCSFDGGTVVANSIGYWTPTWYRSNPSAQAWHVNTNHKVLPVTDMCIQKQNETCLPSPHHTASLNWPYLFPIPLRAGDLSLVVPSG